MAVAQALFSGDCESELDAQLKISAFEEKQPAMYRNAAV